MAAARDGSTENGKGTGKGKVTRTGNNLPSSDPHTRGIISKMAEQDASSKHSCRASRHLRIATAVFTLGPKNRKIRPSESIKITRVGYHKYT